MSTAIVITFNVRPARATLEAARYVDPLANPIVSTVAAKLQPAVARDVRRILADGVVAGATTAELARRLAAVGVDCRTAAGLARTGAAIITAEARRRCISI